MNKEYKQWKKFLAKPYMLIIFGFVFTMIIFFGVNLIFNFILSLEGIIGRIKEYTATGKQFPVAFSLSWFFIPKKLSGFWVYFCYGGVIGILLGKMLIKLYEIRIAFKDINLKTKGSERFTTKKELDQQYVKVALDDKEYEGSSGIPVATTVETVREKGKKVKKTFVYIDRKNTNSATIGGTQSGKTSLFSYPFLDLIMRAKEKDSVIVNDLKGDMLMNTKDSFEKFGYDVYCLNLVEPTNGIHYNPLDLVKQAYLKGDTTKAQMLANSLSFSLYHNPNAKEPMWEEASISLLNALILAICEIGIETKQTQIINMYAVTSMLEELGAYPDEKGNTALDTFFNDLPPTSVARKQYGTIKFSQGITRSGIFTGTMAKLKNYTYDAIARLTLDSDFNLEDLGYGEKPIALFIVYPDWNDSNYSIISTFLSQVNEVLAERATLTGKGVKRRVRYLLEEAANIPPNDGLSRSMNVGLGRNLIYHLVIQSYAQLDDKYGDKMSKAITAACGNQIYIMSDEYDDADYFAKKLGEKTVIAPDRHGDPMSIDKSFGEREDGRQLLTANELRDLKEGEWVVDRTKMRRDLRGQKITPYPIFANVNDGTEMRFHYEYLLPRFDGEKDLTELKLSKEQHSSIDLVDYIVKWDEYEVDENDKRIPSKEEQQQKRQEKEEERYMAEQVAAIDSVSLDTNIKPTLREQLGESVFEEFFLAAYKDNLSENEKEKLSTFTDENQLRYFCNTEYRPNLKVAFIAFKGSVNEE
ncbi:type IV secretory system conjugative DNA transfer family protein [Enterococcus faecalis]|nr:type IV secretory system conjugative DNA transfer family protein [Enterococcus faecalis]